MTDEKMMSRGLRRITGRGKMMIACAAVLVSCAGQSVSAPTKAGSSKGPAAEPARKVSVAAAPRKAVTPAHAKGSAPSRASAAPAKSAPRPAAKPAPAPRPSVQPRPASKPTPRPSAQPRPRPSNPRPTSRPSPRPSVEPAPPRPTPRPAPRPRTTPNIPPQPQQPQPKPQPQPQPKPQTQPKPQPVPQPGLQPGTPNQPRPVQPGGLSDTPGSSAGEGGGSSPSGASPGGVRAVPVGVQRRDVPMSAITPVVRPGDVPDGFDLDAARRLYLKRGQGSLKDMGPGLQERPDGAGDGHDDHHDHDDHDGHHGDHDGHHGDHHDDDWDIDININFWTHHDYCPGGWWYVYGDYNHDGFTDYVCTNGSYSIYWYGWSGSYWDCSPWYGWYPSRHGYRWWSYSVPDRYRGVVYGSGGDLADEAGVTPPAPESMPDAVPLSALEVARLEMSIGEPQVAIEAYRSHLSAYPDDWLAMRELGLAMIRNGQRGDGVAILSYAYTQDPQLAWDALPVELFGGDNHLLRDTVVDVVGWGHRNPSASAWLSVAVLMQAEGKDGPALRMIERAQEYGLDPEIARTMRAVLASR